MPANNAFVLGVTGGIASGKSHASNYLLTLGADVIDADAESRALTAHPDGAALPAIRAAFGDTVFDETGALNRRALGDIVFADENMRRKLEAILHPMVRYTTLNRIETADSPVVVLNVPLLFETGMDALCDAVWVMALEPEKQVMRLMKRDALSREQAIKRIESQMPLAEKVKHATAVISTDRPKEETQKELAWRYKEILNKL